MVRTLLGLLLVVFIVDCGGLGPRPPSGNRAADGGIGEGPAPSTGLEAGGLLAEVSADLLVNADDVPALPNALDCGVDASDGVAVDPSIDSQPSHEVARSLDASGGLSDLAAGLPDLRDSGATDRDAVDVPWQVADGGRDAGDSPASIPIDAVTLDTVPLDVGDGDGSLAVDVAGPDIANDCVVGTQDAPVPSSVFIAAGGGRGPLSTTITTATTSVDNVPTVDHQTIRVMLRTTVAGSAVMVKLTNRFSAAPLPIGAAHLAIRSSGGSIVPESDRTLSFAGVPSATVDPGAELWSDAVDLPVARTDTLAISLYVDGQLTPTTECGRGNVIWMKHYLSAPGDFTAEATMPAATSGPTTTHTILFVSELRVQATAPAATLVALGDSITEGAASTAENGDWPDLLSDRLSALPDGTAVSVFNAGIGSGRFMSCDGAGLRGRARLTELLELPQVRWITVLMGVNDISYEQAASCDLISAYQEAIAAAHAAGVKIIGIPILPFKGSVKDVGTNWATAEEVNEWIRNPASGFDAVIDFEPIVGDPANPGQMNPALTADKVHPNQAGYTAMANAIDLSIFR